MSSLLKTLWFGFSSVCHSGGAPALIPFRLACTWYSSSASSWLATLFLSIFTATTMESPGALSNSARNTQPKVPSPICSNSVKLRQNRKKLFKQCLLLSLTANTCCWHLLLTLAADTCCWHLLLMTLAANTCCWHLLLTLAADDTCCQHFCWHFCRHIFWHLLTLAADTCCQHFFWHFCWHIFWHLLLTLTADTSADT